MKRIDCGSLVDQISKKIEERVKAETVVRLNDVRTIREPKRPAILWLIDDDDSIRRAFVRIFEGETHHIFSASNAGEIQQILISGAPDLIFLDIGLPWIDGFELATMMKAHRDLARVPIVFISGRDSLETIKQGFQVGAHDFITKPFDVNVVRKTVKTLLALG